MSEDYAITATMTSIQELPAELMLMLLGGMNDLSTLSATLEAFPARLLPLMRIHFNRLLQRVFSKMWSEELCQYTYTIIMVQSHEITTLQDLQDLMTDQLEGTEPRTLPGKFPCSLRTLKELVHLIENIEFFVHFFTATFLSPFPPDKRGPLSSGETLRLRRALLRFQLYTQLFHQPGRTDEIVSDRDWEQRHRCEHFFWTRYEKVEVEEMKCIYVTLVSLLEHTGPVYPSYDQDCNVAVCEYSSHRGLLLLRPLLADAPLSPLASSYAQRFVEYAYTGLTRVDPHDGNWFLPYHDAQKSDRRRVKRYLPSEVHREGNFGVTIYTCPMKYRAVRKYDDRTRWRLIGYCFWDEDRINFSADLLEL